MTSQQIISNEEMDPEDDPLDVLAKDVKLKQPQDIPLATLHMQLSKWDFENKMLVEVMVQWKKEILVVCAEDGEVKT